MNKPNRQPLVHWPRVLIKRLGIAGLVAGIALALYLLALPLIRCVAGEAEYDGNPCLHWFHGMPSRRRRPVITVCRLLGGGASLSMLHEAPVPKERNEGSEEHAQPLSLVAR